MRKNVYIKSTITFGSEQNFAIGHISRLEKLDPPYFRYMKLHCLMQTPHAKRRNHLSIMYINRDLYCRLQNGFGLQRYIETTLASCYNVHE